MNNLDVFVDNGQKYRRRWMKRWYNEHLNMSGINTNENLAQILQARTSLSAMEKTIFEVIYEHAIEEVRLMKYQECYDCKNYISVYNEKDGVHDLPYKSCSCEEA